MGYYFPIRSDRGFRLCIRPSPVRGLPLASDSRSLQQCQPSEPFAHVSVCYASSCRRSRRGGHCLDSPIRSRCILPRTDLLLHRGPWMSMELKRPVVIRRCLRYHAASQLRIRNPSVTVSNCACVTVSVCDGGLTRDNCFCVPRQPSFSKPGEVELGVQAIAVTMIKD